MYGSGFMNLERLLGVNRDSGTNMGNQLATPIQKQGVNFDNDLKAAGGVAGNLNWDMKDAFGNLGERAVGLQNQAKELGTMKGRESMLQDKYGKAGNYNKAQSGFDALTSGWSPEVDKVSSAYSNLAQQVGAVQQQAMKTREKAQGAADAEKASKDRYNRYGEWEAQRKDREGKRQSAYAKWNALVSRPAPERYSEASQKEEAAAKAELDKYEKDLADWSAANPPPGAQTEAEKADDAYWASQMT